MGHPGPAGLSVELKADTWRRWRAGYSFREISRALQVDHGSIRHVLLLRGGFSPAARTRAVVTLTLAEREDISRGLASSHSVRSIARRLNRAASTVSREIRRHGGRSGYRAHQADLQAWDSAQRPKACLLSLNGKLRRLVTGKLQLEWSPEQISGWLKRHFCDDERMRVSHETIYRSLFIQTRGVLKKELMKHLRTRRSMRRPKQIETHAERRGRIADAVSIRERPADIEDRAVPGHWEGDLIGGSKNSHIVTLVERQSRFTTLVKVRNRETETVVAALTRHARRLPASLRKSLTWDRGQELAQHKSFTVATDVKVYFCDPRSPWQRGTNENTNGLLRQYFPKGTDLSGHSQSYLDKIALRLNQRPRKTLGFQTPADKLNESVASTT
jgi:IS30 family transposase